MIFLGIFMGYSILQYLEMLIAFIITKIERYRHYVRGRISEPRDDMEFASQQNDDCLVESENVSNDYQEAHKGMGRHCFEKSDWEEKQKALETQMKEMEIRMARMEKISWN